MDLSQRVLSANESQTLAIAAKAKTMAKSGIDVVILSTGEPDFPTPDCAKSAALQAIAENFTHYTESNGILELREAVAEKFRRENGIPAKADEILISTGAKHSIDNALQAICNPSDEVIIIAPYWVSYPAMAHLAGGTPKIIKTTISSGFKVTPEQLHSALSPKTKCIIFNSPNNPTGSMYSHEEFTDLSEVLQESDCLILSDEIYEKIVYGPVQHFSPASLPNLKDRVLTVNGVSKAYSMTGWRVGFLHAPKEIITQAAKVQSQSTSNPNSIAQKAALGALLNGAEDVERMRLVFAKRRDLILGLMNEIKGVNIPIPDGAFYIFADISKCLNDEIPTSAKFCEMALDKFHVALVPGEAFGAEGCVRFSFATSEEIIQKGVERFAQAIEALR